MSDDRTFDVSYNERLAAMNGGVTVIREPLPLRPTIGQTWTDPATGQEVMVVPVEATDELIITMGEAIDTRGYDYEVWSAMLASLRAKEGK